MINQTDVDIQPRPFDEIPTEPKIRERMEQEGLQPYLWSNGPGDVYAAHTHTCHKVIYVMYGSITFGLPTDGQKTTLEAGDRIDLPAKTVHDAVVGPAGVVCLEGHR